MWDYKINPKDEHNDDYNKKLNQQREREWKKWSWRMKTDEEIENILTTQDKWRQKDNKWKSRKKE